MVERFLIPYDARGEQAHPSGDFVHYADYIALKQKMDSVAAVLKPFAAAADRHRDDAPGHLTIDNLRAGSAHLITLDDCRAARSELDCLRSGDE